MTTTYVIECRDQSGNLDFTDPQPEQIFGMAAITGITEDQMAQVIWRRGLDPVLTGQDVPRWPSHVDPRFRARVKTW